MNQVPLKISGFYYIKFKDLVFFDLGFIFHLEWEELQTKKTLNSEFRFTKIKMIIKDAKDLKEEHFQSKSQLIEHHFKDEI